MGIEKCKNWTREIMYWPELSKDIESDVEKYETCTKFRNTQSNEVLPLHAIPEKNFQKLGID